MAAYCKVYGHYCKVQQEVTQRHDSFSGVHGHISCWRAITLNLTATVFWRKSKQFCMYRRFVTALRRHPVSCVATSNFYEGSSFDVVRVSRLQTQRITLEPKTKTYFPLTNLQIASLCSTLRVSGNPMTGRDWTGLNLPVCLLWFQLSSTHTHCAPTSSSVTTKLIQT